MTDSEQLIDRATADAIERGHLRLQLMEASREKQEYLRTAKLLIALRQNLMFSLLPLEECLTAVYGADGSRRFWEIQLSRPMTLDTFVRRLVVTGADSESGFEPRQMALRAAILEAHQMGETWFRGDTSTLVTARYGNQVQGDAVTVIPRLAAEWLICNPLWCHLVPSSLAGFLQPQEPPNYSTGAPGRPTSRQLVEIEMERRATAGEMITASMAQEAAALSAWLKREHPGAPQMTPKTIQCVMASRYRTLKSQTQLPHFEGFDSRKAAEFCGPS